MAYPLINGTRVIGIADYMNLVANGWFWEMMILMIFIIMFINLKDYSTGRALLASSFLSTVLAMVLYWGGLISAIAPTLGVVVVCLGVGGMWLSGGSGGI